MQTSTIIITSLIAVSAFAALILAANLIFRYFTAAPSEFSEENRAQIYWCSAINTSRSIFTNSASTLSIIFNRNPISPPPQYNNDDWAFGTTGWNNNDDGWDNNNDTPERAHTPPPSPIRQRITPSWFPARNELPSAITSDVIAQSAPLDYDDICPTCHDTVRTCDSPSCICRICCESCRKCSCPRCPVCRVAIRRVYDTPMRCLCDNRCGMTGLTLDSINAIVPIIFMMTHARSAVRKYRIAPAGIRITYGSSCQGTNG